MQIEVHNLTKNFGDARVLKNLSFSIGQGEVVGFLGPNGAGKTTTMRILTGFLAPTGGNVKIAEKNILDDTLGVRKKIGYLPENNPVYNDLRVYEHLTYIAKTKNVSDINKEVKRVIHLCGLSGRISQSIGELSKGFKQRVGLAQALIGDPEILILDEPTSGLDPNQIIEIRNLIRKIGEKKTILLSTHILGEVHTTCTRAIIIHNGKIVASGTTDELVGQSQGKTHINAVIAGPAIEIQQKIQNMSGIASVKHKEGAQNGEHAFAIESATAVDARKNIFDLCVHSGWTLLELERKQMSLEDVFASLTK